MLHCRGFWKPSVCTIFPRIGKMAWKSSLQVVEKRERSANLEAVERCCMRAQIIDFARPEEADCSESINSRLKDHAFCQEVIKHTVLTRRAVLHCWTVFWPCEVLSATLLKLWKWAPWIVWKILSALQCGNPFHPVYLLVFRESFATCVYTFEKYAHERVLQCPALCAAFPNMAAGWWNTVGIASMAFDDETYTQDDDASWQVR